MGQNTKRGDDPPGQVREQLAALSRAHTLGDLPALLGGTTSGAGGREGLS